MACRRRQVIGRSSTFNEEIYRPLEQGGTPATYSTSSSLAAQAIMASAAHRDSFHSSAYAQSAFKGGPTYDYTAMGSSNEAGSFWKVLARKARAILEDNNVPYQSEYCSQTRPEMLCSSREDQVDIPKKMDNPTLCRGLDTLTSSLLEEGRTNIENKTADITQETRKIQVRRKGINEGYNLVSGAPGPWQQSLNLNSQEDQLKASRDVAMATAAKAKLLLRELKTVKADLAFAKQRCSQLEEENKILREAREKGVNRADDDMIRLQLETLVAEKARLANENSVYARENRFLREIVEYHQMTMEDVVYLDEDIEEVREVYPISAVSRTLSAPSMSLPSASGIPLSRARSSSSITKLEMLPNNIPRNEARSKEC